MSDVQVDPYLFFEGDAKEAMEFYKSVFGGELSISKMSEMPGSKPEDADRVMHALLDGDVRLMASDSREASPEAKKIEISISGEDEAKLRGYFDKLSQGGKVNMPLEKAPWGDTFGMLTDKNKISWMVNVTTPKAEV